jgi:manganese transport system ATP-binding protein
MASGIVGLRSALCVEGVSVHYRDVVALQDVSFRVAPGEVVAVVGPNGAGKSSLFRAVLGLVGHEGRVMLDGRACRRRARRVEVAYLPQRADVDLDFPIVVREVVAGGRRRFLRCGQPLRALDRARVDDALAAVGLTELANRSIGAISGGELQRVFLARAIAQEATILLLDEALSGVDQPRTHELLGLFDALAGHGAAILVATHDLALARRRFHRCLALNRRLVADGPPTECLCDERLEAVFGSGPVPAAA